MPKDKRIYLSGPMTGLPSLNHPAFNAEAERLRALGYFVINPAEVDLDEGATWEDYLRTDLIAMLDTCNAIVMLPGWEKSRGATLEHHVACALGFEVSYADGEAPVVDEVAA